jgi:hypothetical protein
MKRRCTICCPTVRPVQIQQKAHRDTLWQICVFASSGICGSHCDSGASGVRNDDALYFMLRYDRYGFHKRRESRCPFRYVWGMKSRRIIYDARVGPL